MAILTQTRSCRIKDWHDAKAVSESVTLSACSLGRRAVKAQVYGWLYETCVCSVCCMSAVLWAGVVVRTNAFTWAGVHLSLCMMCMQYCKSVYVCMNAVRERKTARERETVDTMWSVLLSWQFNREMTRAMSQAGRPLTATTSCSNLGQQQVVTQCSRVFVYEGQAVLFISS